MLCLKNLRINIRMSIALNKIVKIFTCALLCLCIAVSLCACGTKNIKNIDQIGVRGCYADSVSYTIGNEEFISTVTDMYNDLRYEDTDASINVTDDMSVYMLNFYQDGGIVATLVIDEKNNIQFGAGTTVYHIKKGFEYDEIDKLINDYLETNDLTAEAETTAQTQAETKTKDK